MIQERLNLTSTVFFYLDLIFDHLCYRKKKAFFLSGGCTSLYEANFAT